MPANSSLRRASKSDPSRSVSAARRSPCPISCYLDLLGDRWTLLVVRDLFFGKKRYGEFAASPEGIPTNILADRLKQLEANGLIERTVYQNNPPRHEYSLTAKAKDLGPVFQAMAAWSKKHVPGVAEPPKGRTE